MHMGRTLTIYHHVLFLKITKLCLRTWNAETLLECSTLDKIVTPTKWQRDQFPPFLRDHIDVIHEGVDTGIDISSLKSQPFLPIFDFFDTGFQANS